MLTIPAPWGTAPQVVGPSGHLGTLVFRHPFSDDGLVVQHEPEVDAWFDRYDNPQKDLVLAVRDVVLEADARVGECIKWQAPTFTYEGNIASFFPKAKKHVSLMFHTGASLPDPQGILEGDGATSRSLKIVDDADLVAKTAALQGLVRSWIEQKGR